MNEKHDFSKEYEEKKKALLRSIEKADRVEKRQHRMPVMRAITAVVLAIVMLSGGVFAATRLGLFNIKREEDKILVEIATGEAVSQDDFVNDYFDEFYDRENRKPKQMFALYRGYMPPITGCEPGYERPQRIGNKRGGVMHIFMTRYLEGKEFALKLPSFVKTEDFEVNGHRAGIAYYGETFEYDKLIFVDFEEENIVVICTVGNLISAEETKKFAEGLRLEESDDVSLAWGITINLNDFTDYGQADLARFPNLDTMEEMSFGDSMRVKLSKDEKDIEITPLEVNIYDSAKDFEYEKFGCCFDDKNEISLFMDEDGNFIEYPRTPIIKGESETELDRFGETSLVKKKLVCVKYRIKNLSNEKCEPIIGTELYFGNEYADYYMSYVYDRTPHKYVSNICVYQSVSGGEVHKLSSGEETEFTVYYLVDEDHTDEMYFVFLNYGKYVNLAD